MRKPALRGFDRAVHAYLASRRALGRGYVKEELIFAHLRAFLLRERAADLDQTHFERWRAQFYHLSASTRVVREHAVYKLCRYRRRAERGCFLPDRATLARARPHPLPTLIEPAQIVRLLRHVARLRPTRFSPLRPAVLRLGIVLLYTAGLRRGELLGLQLRDVEAQASVLRIRESKFHKSRWVPLSDSAGRELQRYLRLRRRQDLDLRPEAPLLCRAHGRPYSGAHFHRVLTGAMRASGMVAPEGRCPRVQDFRHSFAVAALLRWYRSGADVQVKLPKLALYMGHVSIVSTAYYLRLMPAVLAQASRRFAHEWGGLVQEDAS